jgi:hypothetical protein
LKRVKTNKYNKLMIMLFKELKLDLVIKECLVAIWIIKWETKIKFNKTKCNKIKIKTINKTISNNNNNSNSNNNNKSSRMYRSNNSNKMIIVNYVMRLKQMQLSFHVDIISHVLNVLKDVTSVQSAEHYLMI